MTDNHEVIICEIARLLKYSGGHITQPIRKKIRELERLGSK